MRPEAFRTYWSAEQEKLSKTSERLPKGNCAGVIPLIALGDRHPERREIA